jgi:hypothetical protein
MKKVTIITRSFQARAGKDGKKFNEKFFAKKVAKPIEKLIHYKNVKKIIVVINGQPGNRLAEIVTDNKCPTLSYLWKYFPKEAEKGIIHPHICTNWGDNPGSATALNEGMKIAKQDGAEWLLNWSPEIEMDGFLIHEAFLLAEQRSLDVVGALRESWWERPQWAVAQNTSALWHVETLSKIGGFDRECNGTGETVYTPKHGDVPLAGMEDFHAMLRLIRDTPDFRWGMVKRTEPLKWNTDFEPGSEREKNHLIKIERQYAVMQAYARQIFPGISFKKIMDIFFARLHLG